MDISTVETGPNKTIDSRVSIAKLLELYSLPGGKYFGVDKCKKNNPKYATLA